MEERGYIPAGAQIYRYTNNYFILSSEEEKSSYPYVVLNY